MSRLYGYDKHMKLIHDGSVIRFTLRGERRVGQLWYSDWGKGEFVTREANWVISFNHCGGENSIDIGREGDDLITCISVIGHASYPDYRDEELLTLDIHSPNSPDSDWVIALLPPSRRW